MRDGIAVVLSLVAGSTLSSHAGAQTLPLNAGDEIRIESRGIAGEFTVMSVAADSLTVRRGDLEPNQTITAGDLTWLEVSRGRSSFGAIVGGTLGTVAGAVLGLALTFEQGSPVVGFVAITGGMLGGGALGVRFLGPKRWDQILP